MKILFCTSLPTGRSDDRIPCKRPVSVDFRKRGVCRVHHVYEKPHYTFETDMCRADRFLAVHPSSRRNQEQTVSDPRSQVRQRKATVWIVCHRRGRCLNRHDTVSTYFRLLHDNLSIYAHFILPIL